MTAERKNKENERNNLNENRPHRTFLDAHFVSELFHYCTLGLLKIQSRHN